MKKKDKKIQITKNQIRILEIVSSFRYVRLKELLQITMAQGFYMKLSNLSGVIKGLEKNGYLKSKLMGDHSKVIYISKLGAKKLAFELNIPFKDISIPNQGKIRQFSSLEHTMKIISLYLKVLNELKNFPDLRLIKWLGDQQVRCPYEFKSNRSGKVISRTLAPDSYFEIEKSEVKYKFFFEYDSGEMDRKQLAQKFMKYFEYFVYGDWNLRFEVFPKIIFITDRSEISLNNLLTNPEKTLDQAKINRKYFMESKNVLWLGIGLSENVRSQNGKYIQDFLNQQFIFELISKPWEENLLKQV